MNIRDLIEVDVEKMSGTPCFTGTRVPVAHLFDYLEAGDSLDEFLTDFPTVTREQVLGVLGIRTQDWIGSVPPRGSGWVNDQI